MRLAYPNRVGTLARIVSAIGKEGGDIGAVDIVASDTKGMTQAAVHAIADCIAPRELTAEYIVPSVFNRELVQRVAAAVQRAAL